MLGASVPDNAGENKRLAKNRQTERLRCFPMSLACHHVSTPWSNCQEVPRNHFQEPRRKRRNCPHCLSISQWYQFMVQERQCYIRRNGNRNGVNSSVLGTAALYNRGSSCPREILLCCHGLVFGSRYIQIISQRQPQGLYLSVIRKKLSEEREDPPSQALGRQLGSGCVAVPRWEQSQQP